MNLLILITASLALALATEPSECVEAIRKLTQPENIADLGFSILHSGLGYNQMGDKGACDASPGHAYAALIVTMESHPEAHLGATGLCVPASCSNETYFSTIEE